jgi:NADPH-dependent curcumin reductase CurA
MNDNGVVLAASHLGVEGRLLREHAAEIPETIAVLSSLLRSGELKVVETIRSGFKFLGSTLFEMARGSLRGKVLVEVGSTAFRSVASGINLSYPLSKLEHISGGVGNLPAGNMKEGMHFEGANVRGDRIKSTSYEANKRWVVARLAQKNEPVVSCFHLLDTDMPLPESLREGELILKMALFSVDAYLRERLNSQSRETFVTRLVVGQVMDSFAIGLVTHSRRVGFVAGGYFV